MSVFEVEGGAPLRGRLRVPGDKSISHRALMIAARAQGTSKVTGLSPGLDVVHTADCLQAMGAVIDGDRITGGNLHEPDRVLDVGNSGTGMRLLAGYVAPFPWLTVLAGDASVSLRPMDRVLDPLRLMGAKVDGRDDGVFPPLVVRGGELRGIDFTPRIASSQIKGAVLFAGLGAEGETVLHEKLPTRVHTEELFELAGADIEWRGQGSVRLRPGPLQPIELEVPGDPSQAAFWAVAATIIPGSELVLEHVYVGMGRSAFVDVLVRMGANIELDHFEGGCADLVVRSAELHGTEVFGEEVPALIDEIPVLAVAASVADGHTTFRDAEELRVKETDRIATITSELSALGARVEPLADGLVVPGGSKLNGGSVRSHGDHRIAMAMAVAGMAGAGLTRIDGWDAVDTSYPGFARDLDACRS